MQQPDDLIVKFKTIGLLSKTNVTDHLNKMVGKHVFDKVEQMFPDEADSNLASIYVAKMSGSSEINHVIDSLNKESEIDYAHVPANRKGF